MEGSSRKSTITDSGLTVKDMKTNATMMHHHSVRGFLGSWDWEAGRSRKKDDWIKAQIHI